jgi:hypothetical protein
LHDLILCIFGKRFAYEAELNKKWAVLEELKTKKFEERVQNLSKQNIEKKKILTQLTYLYQKQIDDSSSGLTEKKLQSLLKSLAEISNDDLTVLLEGLNDNLEEPKKT